MVLLPFFMEVVFVDIAPATWVQGTVRYQPKQYIAQFQIGCYCIWSPQRIHSNFYP